VAFDIRFLTEWTPGSETGNAGRFGRITLDDFSETFVSLIGFWSPYDYEVQWRRGVERLVGERRNSCLITSLHDPAATEMLMWWLLYPDGDRVVVQQALLFFANLDRTFSTNDPFSSIPPRRQITEEGEAISEWSLDFASFREFLDSAP
jgi:hypothetical protein